MKKVAVSHQFVLERDEDKDCQNKNNSTFSSKRTGHTDEFYAHTHIYEEQYSLEKKRKRKLHLQVYR